MNNHCVQKLKEGQVISFRPKGNSMLPRIKSGNLVTVSPDISSLSENDVVFCKVKGRFYVHLIKSIKKESNLYLISNNKGRINGWISKTSIFGKVIEIAD